MTLPVDLIRPREITGMSAILLPMLDELALGHHREDDAPNA